MIFYDRIATLLLVAQMNCVTLSSLKTRELGRAGSLPIHKHAKFYRYIWPCAEWILRLIKFNRRWLCLQFWGLSKFRDILSSFLGESSTRRQASRFIKAACHKPSAVIQEAVSDSRFSQGLDEKRIDIYLKRNRWYRLYEYLDSPIKHHEFYNSFSC